MELRLEVAEQRILTPVELFISDSSGLCYFYFYFISFFILFSSFHDCTHAKQERKKYLRNRQGQQDRLCIPDSETFDGRGRVKECFKYK